MIEKVTNRKNLLKAYHQVLSNKGAAGVDGMGVKALSAHLKENGQQIGDSLRAGTYLSQPILGIEIPKANGKKRLLGIPSVTERWLQQAVHQVITPLFEPDFKEHTSASGCGYELEQLGWCIGLMLGTVCYLYFILLDW
jgi:RNA-directed DNA polymerase